MFPEKTRELEIAVDLVADMTVINPFDFFVEAAAEKFPFAYTPEQLRASSRPTSSASRAGAAAQRVDRAHPRATVLGKPINTVDLLVGAEPHACSAT